MRVTKLGRLRLSASGEVLEAGGRVQLPMIVNDTLWHFVRLSWSPSLQRAVLQLDGWPTDPLMGFAGGAHVAALLPDIDAVAATAVFGTRLHIGTAARLGAIDEVRVFMGEEQIEAPPRDALAGNEPGLLAYYRFEELPLPRGSVLSHATGPDAAPSVRADSSGVPSAVASSRHPDTHYTTSVHEPVTVALHTTAQPGQAATAGVIASWPAFGNLTVDGEQVSALPYRFAHSSIVRYVPHDVPCTTADGGDAYETQHVEFEYMMISDSVPKRSTVGIAIRVDQDYCAAAPQAWDATFTYKHSGPNVIELPVRRPGTCLLHSLPENGTLFTTSGPAGSRKRVAALHAIGAALPGCSLLFETAAIDGRRAAHGSSFSFTIRACAGSAADGECVGKHTDAEIALMPERVDGARPAVLLGYGRAAAVSGSEPSRMLASLAAPLQHSGTVQLSLLVSALPQRRAMLFRWGKALSLLLTGEQLELVVGNSDVVVRAPQEHGLRVNTWQVVTVSWDGLMASLLIDGSPVASAAAPDAKQLTAVTLDVYAAVQGLVSDVRAWPTVAYKVTPEHLVQQLLPDFLDATNRLLRPATQSNRGPVSRWAAETSSIVAGAPFADAVTTSADEAVSIQLSAIAANTTLEPKIYITTLPEWGSLQLPNGAVITSTPAVLTSGVVWYVPGAIRHTCRECAVEVSFKYAGGFEGGNGVMIAATAEFRVLVQPPRTPPAVLSPAQPIFVRMNQAAPLSVEAVAAAGVPHVVLDALPTHGSLQPRRPQCTHPRRLEGRVSGECAHYMFWPDVNAAGRDAIVARADDGHELSEPVQLAIDIEADHAVRVGSTRALRALLGDALEPHWTDSGTFTLEAWVRTGGAVRFYALSGGTENSTLYRDGTIADDADAFGAALRSAARAKDSSDGPLDAHVDELLLWDGARNNEAILSDMSTSWDSATPAAAPLQVIEQFYASSKHVSSSDPVISSPLVGAAGAALNMSDAELELACGDDVAGPFTVGLYIRLDTEPKAGKQIVQRADVFTLGWDGDGQLTFAVGSQSLDSAGAAHSAARLDSGRWHYISGAYTAHGGVRLYIDGELADFAWSGVQLATHDACAPTKVRSFGGAISSFALHNASLHDIFTVTAPHQVLYGYERLATLELWLLNEGQGVSVHRSLQNGSLAGSGAITGAASWLAPAPLDSEDIWVPPGAHVCIPLQVTDYGVFADVVVTAVPLEGFVFEADIDCKNWRTRVHAGETLTGRNLVYAAPVHPTGIEAGDITYIATNGKGHSRPVLISVHTAGGTPRCRCAMQACHELPAGVHRSPSLHC